MAEPGADVYVAIGTGAMRPLELTSVSTFCCIEDGPWRACQWVMQGALRFSCLVFAEEVSWPTNRYTSPDRRRRTQLIMILRDPGNKPQCTLS